MQRHYDNSLVVDLESIGSYRDDQSDVPLLYQLLGAILYELKEAIEEEIETGRGQLNVSIPDTIQFYRHPTPLRYFQEVLKDFKRATTKNEKWHRTHLVLLLDEFSYLHGLIAPLGGFHEELEGNFSFASSSGNTSFRGAQKDDH